MIQQANRSLAFHFVAIADLFSPFKVREKGLSLFAFVSARAGETLAWRNALITFVIEECEIRDRGCLDFSRSWAATLKDFVMNVENQCNRNKTTL